MEGLRASARQALPHDGGPACFGEAGSSARWRACVLRRGRLFRTMEGLRASARQALPHDGGTACFGEAALRTMEGLRVSVRRLFPRSKKPRASARPVPYIRRKHLRLASTRWRLVDRSPIDPCQITQVCAASSVSGAASSLLYHTTVRVLRSPILFAIAVAGTALLSGPTSTLLARQDLATASAPIVVEVTAKRFAFEPDQIEVTEGDRVRLVVSSADGVHGIGIKKFKVDKKDPAR